jgi:hypothetical protein
MKMRTTLCLIAIQAIAVTYAATTSAQDPAEVAHVRATRVISLLKSPAVRKELELAAEQIDDLIKLDLLRSQLTSKLFRINDFEYEERKRIYSAYRQEVVNLEQQATALLLPNQLKRLNQIVFQEMVQAAEPHCGLIHNRVIEDLGLVEPQLQVVRAKAVEAESKFKKRVEELQAELAKAKEEMRADVLSALTPEQRKKYEELVGTPVKLRDE